MAPCEDVTGCEVMEAMMYADLTPGGQYAGDDQVSILRSDSKLSHHLGTNDPNNWQHPVRWVLRCYSIRA